MAPLCPATHRDDRPRQAADGLVLCWSCRDRLERHIAELPALHDACGRALLAASGPGTAGRVSGSTTPGLSLSDPAVAARGHIVAELHSWARIALEEGPWTQAPADRLEAIATWLVGRCDWLAAREWAAEIARTMADTHAEAKRAAWPDPAKRVRIGRCPEPGCEGELTAIVRRADSLLPSDVRCSATPADDEDPHVWTSAEWQALRRRMTAAGYAELARRIGSG